jgi:hypothetical protein
MHAGGICAACALGDACSEAGDVAEGSLGRIGGHHLVEIIARGRVIWSALITTGPSIPDYRFKG